MKKIFFLMTMLALIVVFLPCLSLAAETVSPPEGADIAATLLGWLPASWEGWVTFVVTICAAVSAVWPRPSEKANPVLRLLYTVVNALGFNAGKAKNADDVRGARLLDGMGGSAGGVSTPSEKAAADRAAKL